MHSGIETKFGLTDFISSMSQPSWVWSNGWDFPRLYTWDDDAKTELFNLFNYDSSLLFRGQLDLEEPNFENISLPELCNSDQFPNYCNISEDVPDLLTTMHLMNLAKFPLNVKDIIKENLQLVLSNKFILNIV